MLAQSSNASWLSEAKAIGDRLGQSVHRNRDGTVLWLKPGQPFDERGEPLLLGPHLHAGYLGTALFLAALGQTLAEPSYQQLARQTLAPLRRQLAFAVANPAAAAKHQFKLGGVAGLGAFLYGLLRLGRWLDESALVEESCAIATLITPERIEQDTALDLMYGSAGAILCLLRLDEEITEAQRAAARPLDRAIACAEHLLRRKTVDSDGGCGWATFRPPSCGLGHGASGMAYALAALAERTGREDFRQTAREGLVFERLHYQPEQRNWQSLRHRDDAFMNAWCNGAPGIALARLKLLQGGLDLGDEEGLEVALETTTDRRPSSVDIVCCGDVGRAEILFEAARQLGREDLGVAAEEMAARTFARLRERGAYRCPYNDKDKVNPTFFKGIAGIGYTWLRFSGADLPCVLALE